MKSKKVIIAVIVLILVIAVPTGFVVVKNFKQDKSYKEYVEKANTLVAEKKYDEAMEVLQKGKDIKVTDEINNKITLVQSYIDQMKLYQEATALVEAGKYDAAIDELNKVDSALLGLKEQVEEKIKFCKSEIVRDKSKAVEQLLSENKFEEAYNILSEIITVDVASKEIEPIRNKVDTAKANYEKEQQRIKEEDAKKVEEERKKKQAIKITPDDAVKVAEKKHKEVSGKQFYKYGAPMIMNVEGVGECYNIVVYHKTPTGMWVDILIYSLLVETNNGSVYVSWSGDKVEPIESTENKEYF